MLTKTVFADQKSLLLTKNEAKKVTFRSAAEACSTCCPPPQQNTAGQNLVWSDHLFIAAELILRTGCTWKTPIHQDSHFPYLGGGGWLHHPIALDQILHKHKYWLNKIEGRTTLGWTLCWTKCVSLDKLHSAGQSLGLDVISIDDIGRGLPGALAARIAFRLPNAFLKIGKPYKTNGKPMQTGPGPLIPGPGGL